MAEELPEEEVDQMTVSDPKEQHDKRTDERTALVLHFDDDDTEGTGLDVEPWVLEQFEYFSRLLGGSFSEAKCGEARLPCRREVYETFLMLARRAWRPAAVDLGLRMEVLRFADMCSAPDLVQLLADSIRTDYLLDGDGARDSAVLVLCELADLLAPPVDSGLPDLSVPVAPSPRPPTTGGAQLAPAAPTPAAMWLVAAATVNPAPVPSVVPTTTATTSSATVPPQSPNEPNDPLVKLREACLEALPPWTRQRFAEKPQLWRLDLEDVLDVYGAEASPRAESSWLALIAARRISKDILPFASADNEATVRLAQSHPEMVIRRCISLYVRELPFSKSVSGFGGTGYQIQVALSGGEAGGWVLGVGSQGLCALRKVVLEIEDCPGHELEFTGLMDQENAVLGFASSVQHVPLPFSAKLMILEYPVHLAVQTYIGLNFNTMAVLCQHFEFGRMDLACVTDLWLQSEQLRRVPETEMSDVVRRTLRFVRLRWAPVVRVSFVVCMHKCWTQAMRHWWHASLIRSCLELEVWRGPANGELGAGTFRSYVAQIVQHALAPNPECFVSALQVFVEGLPPVTHSSLETFFQPPTSVSDPVAITARHYLELLRTEVSMAAGSGHDSADGSVKGESVITVAVLAELLEGFRRLVGPALERSEPRTAVLAFLSLVALCDLWHQRQLSVDALASLATLEKRPPDGPEVWFWASCFFTLLEFTWTLLGNGTQSGSLAGNKRPNGTAS